MELQLFLMEEGAVKCRGRREKGRGGGGGGGRRRWKEGKGDGRGKRDGKKDTNKVII